VENVIVRKITKYKTEKLYLIHRSFYWRS